MTTKNETIEVKSNESKRTFTIRSIIDGKLFAKYRTTTMSKKEYESNEFNTEADWKYFLRSTNDYYKVHK